jgi:all-trans-nonaprenyl-diphosphate synthase
MQVVGSQNPVLMSAAKQIFGAGGKRMRPALIFLVSKATAEVAGLKYILLSHCSSLEHANYIPVVWICVVPN